MEGVQYFANEKEKEQRRGEENNNFLDIIYSGKNRKRRYRFFH